MMQIDRHLIGGNVELPSGDSTPFPKRAELSTHPFDSSKATLTQEPASVTGSETSCNLCQQNSLTLAKFLLSFESHGLNLRMPSDLESKIGMF